MFQVGGNLAKLPTQMAGYGLHLRKSLDNVAKKNAYQCLSIIKSPGYCPVRTGMLRNGHFITKSGDITYDIRNHVHYWIYVVYGRKNKGRLRTKNEIQNKKHSGTRGLNRTNKLHTPKPIPNNYPRRAVIELKRGGYMDKHVAEEIHDGTK